MNRHRSFVLSATTAIQRLDLSAYTFTGGSFTITVPGAGTTGAISTITSSGIQTALRAVAGLGSVTVTTLGNASHFRITFTGFAGPASVCTIGSNSVTTTGGAAVTITPVVEQTYSAGTESVTSITADNFKFGDTVKFISTASGQKLVSGSNLKLVADWTSAGVSDTITLVCDGTNWIEQSRKYPYVSSLAVNNVTGLRTRTVIAEGSTILLPAQATAVYALYPGGRASTSATAYVMAVLNSGFETTGAFYFDPADYVEPGHTFKVQIESEVTVNNTASASSSLLFTLWALSSPVGGAGVIDCTVTEYSTSLRPTVYAVGDVTANKQERRVTSSLQTAPTAGWYALGVTLGNAALTANSAVQCKARLVGYQT